jgi:pyrroline-5-carboxylate reductase
MTTQPKFTPMPYSLGFLGAGNMAEAIAKAAIRANILKPGQMIASDPSDTRRALFESFGVKATTSNADVIRQSSQILIAVKPQTIPQLAAELAQHLTHDHILVSIMAGITIAKLSNLITAAGKPGPFRIIRVMPNTPLMSGEGMAGVAQGPDAKIGDDALTLSLFSSAGKAVTVKEELIDAITAVSGSGPAYLFFLAEAMEQAARELGLGDHARLLTAQTLLGSAKLLLESGEAPEELRRKVTSPNGTTHAAITHMESNNLKFILVAAIKAAETRSKELGK